MATAPMILFESIAQSNIPHREKGVITRYLDKMTGGRASDYLDLAKEKAGGLSVHHAEAGGHLIRSTLEHGAVGFGLGALHAEVGLDHIVPIDLVLGGLTGIASAVLCRSEACTDFRNISGQSVGIFAFRKGFALFAEKRLAKGQQPAGTFAKGAVKVAGESDWAGEEDGILAAARNL